MLENKLPNTYKTLTLTVKPLSLPENTLPLTLFTPLANQPWAMWLDSCDSNHVDSRFDIMVWQPEITLSTQGEITFIQYYKNNICQKTQQSTDDPLALIKQLQQQLLGKDICNTNELPFIGGALGYFSYDLGRRFEQLPNSAEQDINLPDMAVGIYSQAIIFDNKSKQYWLICSEEKRQSLTSQLTTISEQSAKQIQKNTAFKLNSSWQANMSKSEYAEKFNQVQAYLLSGDCYQINLAQRFSAQYQGDEFQAYLALRASNQAPFSAFIRLENAAVLSISPERFLSLKKGKVQSKPIKGTKPRHTDKEIDAENAQALQHSTKDKAENVMIVDLLRNDISKVCQAGSVKVPKLFDIESFPAVHHLVSTVEGELASKFDGSDLLRGAFPGGSITGAPKIRAMEIIEELEPHHRSVYCGSIGYLSSCGNMDTSITIRTLVCDSSKNIHCWAGGGLVADSNIACEYQETFDKVSRILPILTEL